MNIKTIQLTWKVAKCSAKLNFSTIQNDTLSSLYTRAWECKQTYTPQIFVCMHAHNIYTCANAHIIVKELCESQDGRPGLSILTSLLVSVDVKLYWTMLRHWSQLVPNMSADIRGHEATQLNAHTHRSNTEMSRGTLLQSVNHEIESQTVCKMGHTNNKMDDGNLWFIVHFTHPNNKMDDDSLRFVVHCSDPNNKMDDDSLYFTVHFSHTSINVDDHRSCERQDGTHMGFSECIDTILNWTEYHFNSTELCGHFCGHTSNKKNNQNVVFFSEPWPHH